MLSARQTSPKKMITYLVALAILVLAAAFFLFKDSIFNSDGTTVGGEEQNLADVLPEIVSLIKPKFSVSKLKDFDVSFLKDSVLETFIEPLKQAPPSASRGKKNPFAPVRVATSTAATSTEGLGAD